MGQSRHSPLWPTLRRVFTATRSLQTEVPLGSERSSGSDVRLPVMITRLMFEPAIGGGPFGNELKVPASLDRGSDGTIGARQSARSFRGVATRRARLTARNRPRRTPQARIPRRRTLQERAPPAQPPLRAQPPSPARPRPRA